MKKFNITAQVYDMCGQNIAQSLLINEIVCSVNADEAQEKFKFDLLVDDIVVQKIFSVEEISQDAC